MAHNPEEARESLRAWITQNLTERRLSATKLARSIGVATTTITKFLNDPAYTFTPSTPVVAKLERYFGRKAPLAPPAGGTELPEIEGAPINTALLAKPLASALAALAAGRHSLEYWEIAGRALEVVGCLPGDIVIVDKGEEPNKGDAVCAELHDSLTGITRTVFRLYEKPYLVTATFDPLRRAPILVDDRLAIIRGVITDRLSRRRGG